MTGLVHLPPEILGMILDLCHPADLIALRATCQSLRDYFQSARKSWMRITDFLGMTGDNEDVSIGDRIKWFEKYMSFRRLIRKGCDHDFVVKRHCFHLSSNSKPKILDSVLLTPQHLKQQSKRAKTTSSSLSPQTRTARDHTFAYAFNQHFFVLAISKKFSNRSHVTGWKILPTSCQDFVSRSTIDFEVPYQHCLVWQTYWICIPFGSNSSSYLNFYDIKANFKLVHKVGSNLGLPILRENPMVYKEGGPQRLYSYKNFIVLIDCIPNWTILIIKITINPDGLLYTDVHKSVRVPNVFLGIEIPFFAADQAKDKFSFAFITQHTRGNIVDPNMSSSIIVTVNLSNYLFSFINPCLGGKFFKNIFIVSGSFQSRELYLLSTFNPSVTAEDTHSDRTSKCLESICLTANDRLFVFGDKVRSREVRFEDQKSISRGDKDWIHNEMVVHRQSVVILQKKSSRWVLFSFDIQSLSNQWIIDGLDIADDGQSRFFLHQGFNFIWLGDMSKITFLNGNSGSIAGKLEWPEIGKPKGSNVPLPDDDTSAFAQRGSSPWQLETLYGRDPCVMVIHDIERMMPFAFDIISLKD